MTISNPDFVKVATGHYKSTLAIDLVNESNFKNLLAAVRKSGDSTQIIYARGADNELGIVPSKRRSRKSRISTTVQDPEEISSWSSATLSSSMFSLAVFTRS